MSGENLGRECIRLTGSLPEILRPPREISSTHTYFPISFMTQSIVYCRPFRLCQVSGLLQNWQRNGHYLTWPPVSVALVMLIPCAMGGRADWAIAPESRSPDRPSRG
jgi:hypothetical protein